MPLLGKSGEVMVLRRVRSTGVQDQGRERHEGLYSMENISTEEWSPLWETAYTRSVLLETSRPCPWNLRPSGRPASSRGTGCSPPPGLMSRAQRPPGVAAREPSSNTVLRSPEVMSSMECRPRAMSSDPTMP